MNHTIVFLEWGNKAKLVPASFSKFSWKQSVVLGESKLGEFKTDQKYTPSK